jgi:hypothetical protein
MTNATEQQTITRLLDTDLGRGMAAEAENTRLAQRREHVEAIVALRKREATEIPPLRAAVKKSDTKRFKLRDELKAVNIAYDIARSAQYGAAASIDAAINVQKGKLIHTADPSIAAFVLELRELEEQMQRHGWDTEEVHSGLWDRLRHPVMKTISNREAFLRRLDALRFEAKPAARALMLEALDATELATRIAEVRAALPVVTPPTDEAPDVAD